MSRVLSALAYVLSFRWLPSREGNGTCEYCGKPAMTPAMNTCESCWSIR